MKVFIDLDVRRIVAQPGSTQGVARLLFKRGDAGNVRVQFCRGYALTQLEAGADLSFALKEEGKYDADPVVWLDGFTEPALANGEYVGAVNFNTTALDALLAKDDDAADDVASVDLMAEFTWSEDSGTTWTSTEPVTGRVHNDVLRGDEAAPTDYLTAAAWLAAQLGYTPTPLAVADPEGVVTATAPTIGLATDGTLWAKVTGSGNTGWRELVAKDASGAVPGVLTLADATDTTPADGILARDAEGQLVIGDGATPGGAWVTGRREVSFPWQAVTGSTRYEVARWALSADRLALGDVLSLNVALSVQNNFFGGTSLFLVLGVEDNTGGAAGAGAGAGIVTVPLVVSPNAVADLAFVTGSGYAELGDAGGGLLESVDAVAQTAMFEGASVADQLANNSRDATLHVNPGDSMSLVLYLVTGGACNVRAHGSVDLVLP